ncbi:MAG TPA: hypothetical protein VGE69_14085 [Pseudomonadales bacterium]
MIPMAINPKNIAILAAVLAVFWAGWEWRDRAADVDTLVHQNEIAALRLEALGNAVVASEQARAKEHALAASLAAVEEAAVLREQEREVVEVEVTREVVVYAENPDVARVVLPGNWVRIHDIAAAGRSAGVPASAFASGRTYEAAGTVTDARALAVATGNYATCNAIRDQLTALQEWVRVAHAPVH